MYNFQIETKGRVLAHWNGAPAIPRIGETLKSVHWKGSMTVVDIIHRQFIKGQPADDVHLTISVVVELKDEDDC